MITSSQPILRLGTRGSPLALAQAEEVRERLLALYKDWPKTSVDITIIRTTGDQIQDRPLSEAGGKGLFTKELEEALLDRRIDLAVHSMKDLPTLLPTGLDLIAILPREDVRDVLITRNGSALSDLPQGATVGTASLRRQAQVLKQRPDLKVVPFRGNVETRLRKLAAEEVDATLLALAGLHRLKLSNPAWVVMPTELMLPAVAQGAIGVEVRANDARISSLLAPLNHSPSAVCVQAERELLAALDGSCRTPIAGLATLSSDGETMTLEGEILQPNGQRVVHARRVGSVMEGAYMGRDLGAELRRRGGPDFFHT